MLKKLLLAATLALATVPAVAQDACRTPAAIAEDIAKVPNVREVITLRQIDVGFLELVDVTIWGDGSGAYLAVAFIDGCYAAAQAMDDETVAEFIGLHTKHADDPA